MNPGEGADGGGMADRRGVLVTDIFAVYINSKFSICSQSHLEEISLLTFFFYRLFNQIISVIIRALLTMA